MGKFIPNRYDEECMEMLESRQHINNDGGSYVQNQVLNGQLSLKKSLFGNVVSNLKRDGIDVAIIDPETFKENKL